MGGTISIIQCANIPGLNQDGPPSLISLSKAPIEIELQNSFNSYFHEQRRSSYKIH